MFRASPYAFGFVPGGAGCGQRHDVQRPEDPSEPCLEPGSQLRPGERQQAQRQLQSGRHHPRSPPVPQGPGRLHVRLHVREGRPEEVQEAPEDRGRGQGLAEEPLVPQLRGHLGGGGGNDPQPSHQPKDLLGQQRLRQFAHSKAEERDLKVLKK